jgi:hypothetical protein
MIFNNFWAIFLRSKSCAISKSIIAGITEINAGKSCSLRLNLIALLGSNTYHPSSSPRKAGGNFPWWYNLYPFLKSWGNRFNIFDL